MSMPHEEHHELPPFWSWTILVLLSVVIVLWGLLNYRWIPDTPRRWDLGVLPDVPGQSPYSTAEPAGNAPVPRQVAPLPEGVPLSNNTATAAEPEP